MRPEGIEQSGGAKTANKRDDFEAGISSPHHSHTSSPPHLFTSTPLHRVTIAGVEVDDLTEDETLDRIEMLIEDGGQHFMAVVNAAKIVAASRDGELRAILSEADLVTADGMSVVWASRLLKRRLRERVTGIDLFERLIERASERGWAIYFLGAKEAVVSALVDKLGSRCPGLSIAGYRNGYFNEGESDSIAGEIRASGADLLFVALGSPAQERWIRENLAKTGARFALGVGGTFDHASGLVPRAPRWMQRAGLEWLHRLVCEPRRLWRRYLLGNTLFIWLVIKQIVGGKVRKTIGKAR